MAGAASPLRNMHPAYFALVMATGIIAIAAHLQQIPPVASDCFRSRRSRMSRRKKSARPATIE